jgi:hypothetical protein
MFAVSGVVVVTASTLRLFDARVTLIRPDRLPREKGAEGTL